MQSDFSDAYQRHFEDAEILFRNQRLANADQLYGISVECGLKRLMLAFGMQFDNANDRPTNRSDRVHANEIWVRYESYRCGHNRGTSYVLPPNPFADWDVSQRYAHQSNFDEIRVSPHKSAAELVKTLMKRARMEGLI